MTLILRQKIKSNVKIGPGCITSLLIAIREFLVSGVRCQGSEVQGFRGSEFIFQFDFEII